MTQTTWKIYKTACLVNGKVYIGQSIRTGSRYRYYFGSGKTFLKAVKKYGIENFVKETLIECNNQELSNEYEALYIELYSSTVNGIGYNILKNSYLDLVRRRDEQKLIKGDKSHFYGKKQSPELIAKRAKLSSERQKGRKFTNQHKKNMVESRKNIVVSESTRLKISKINTGSGNPMYGKKHSLESIRKNSESQKGGKSHVAKKVEAYNKETGEVVIKFNAISEAMKWIKTGNIYQCVKGKCPTAGGYKWKYSN